MKDFGPDEDIVRQGENHLREAGKELTGKTREGLKKYQEANGIKATGTLNQVTLEKMGIGLTEKQKGSGDSR